MMMRRFVSGVMVGTVLQVTVAATAARAAESYGAQFGWGLAAVGANLIYIPAKITYALLGGVVGGLAYALTVGNTEVVETIWSPSLGGTYVLTPRMVAGEDEVYFSGESHD
jgi:hypothetical protein